VRVLFIDLGAYDGRTAELFLERMTGTEHDLTVCCVEANPEMELECRRRFVGDERVSVYGFAVAAEEGVTRLWMDNAEGHGSSIYADKRNVTEEFVEVPARKFSSFFEEVCILGAVTLLKANIEGAECDLVKDMEEHGLFDRVDALLGVAFGKRGNWGVGWVADMAKTPSLRPGIPDVVDILRKHEMRPFVFSGDIPRSVDIVKLVERLGREKDENK